MNKKTVKLKNLTLGDERTKLCIPVTARDEAELKSQCALIRKMPFDMLEMRADYCEKDPLTALHYVRESFPDSPLLFTFRTKEEGGEREIPPGDYRNLNLEAVKEGADLIDLEVNRGDGFVEELIKEIHSGGGKVIASFHDFNGTPSRETLFATLKRLQNTSADMTKIAVMPRNAQDVLALLDAGVQMKEEIADRPYIVLSMGSLGRISRFAGALTGTAVTFASAGASSAPGQIDAQMAAGILTFLSES